MIIYIGVALILATLAIFAFRVAMIVTPTKGKNLAKYNKVNSALFVIDSSKYFSVHMIGGKL